MPELLKDLAVTPTVNW